MIYAAFRTLVLVLISRTVSSNINCSLYLAPSLITGAGRGIFAGTSFSQSDEVGQSVGVLVDSYIIEDLKLADYVFTTQNDYYGIVYFGPAMSFNHRGVGESNVKIKEYEGVNRGEHVGIRPYSTYMDGSFSALSFIPPGQEITFTYGTDEYFAERKADYHTRPSSSTINTYDINELESKGQCISNVYVGTSSVPMAGRGLFSSVSVEKGHVVIVSPVLVVPKHVLERAARSSVLLNYCISSKGTDVALLPMGLAGMINHGGPRRANVVMEWFSWDGHNVTESLGRSNIERDLIGAPSAPLYFSYRALRPIAEGEELLLSYGQEWEQAWLRYTEAMSAWLAVYGDKSSDLTLAPQFRHPIGPPAGLFPQSFFSGKAKKCLSSRDCSEPYSARMPVVTNAALNTVPSTKLLLSELSQSQRQLKEVPIAIDGSAVLQDDEDEYDDSYCELYLAPTSREPPQRSGRVSWPSRELGVFAGDDMTRGQMVEMSQSVLLDSLIPGLHAQLDRSCADMPHLNFAGLLLGQASHFRQVPLPNTKRVLNAEDILVDIPLPQSQALRPFSINVDAVFVANTDIAVGHEVFGPENGAVSASGGAGGVEGGVSYSLSELQEDGMCLTDMYVAFSTIPLGGRGVFTRIPLDENDLVTVSPVLVLPAHTLAEDESSVLINYCFGGNHSDLAFLPTGLAGMMNHGSADRANVEVFWFDWDGRSVRDVLERVNVERDLLSAPTPPLYMGYRTLRPIGRGEELLLSYGEEWEQAWLRYTEAMSAWLAVNGDRGSDLTLAPQFRHLIGPPAGLFPQSFFSGKMKDCVGEGCTGEKKQARATYVHEELNADPCTALSMRSVQESRLFMNSSYEYFPAYPAST